MIATLISSLSTAATPQTPQHRRLVDAAQQFEGMLLQEMLKPLKDSDESQDSDDKSGDTMRSYGTEALAGAMAKSGALGVAHRLVAQVEKQSAAEKTSSGY